MKLQQALIDYGQDTVDKIRQRIIDTETIDTGQLLNSINFTVTPNANSFVIDFSMMEYGRYTDEGTVYINARKFFADVIDDNFKLWEDRILSAAQDDVYDELITELNT